MFKRHTCSILFFLIHEVLSKKKNGLCVRFPNVMATLKQTLEDYVFCRCCFKQIIFKNTNSSMLRHLITIGVFNLPKRRVVSLTLTWA